MEGIRQQHKEIRNSFLDWVNSDDVINTKQGYKTQCSQYTISFSFIKLYRYFIKEYIKCNF